MSVAPPGVNATLGNQPWLCTYATCPVSEFGQLHYVPSLAGNALYLAIFALGLLLQIGLGIRYRTWGFLVAMIGGTGLEIVGYTARIELHIDDFNNNYFIIYLVGLTIGPALFSAAIYLCLARIIAVYGNSLSWLTPRFITCFFMACDLVSLILQAAGGAMASLANTKSQGQTGVNIMIAGLSTQVASTVAFVCICCQLAWSVRQNSLKVNANSLSLRRSTRFRYFLTGESIPSTPSRLSRCMTANGMTHYIALAISTVAILIRCSFRVAELSGGFGGSLANNQISFMILDGAMMAIAVILLTTAHPGLVLGPMWQAGNFRLGRAKKTSRADAVQETTMVVGKDDGHNSFAKTGIFAKTLRR